MDHCESFPIVGSSLIISIHTKWRMGMEDIWMKGGKGWEELGGVEGEIT